MSTSTSARKTIVTVVAMLLLGVVGGLVWLWFAEPAEWEVRPQGIVLTEAASRGQFSVIVTFVTVGVVASIVWGLAAATQLRELGWLVTPVVIVATLVAAVIAWRIGVTLGPPEPASVTGAAQGEKLPAELAVDGIAPFLAWPIFGLLGMLWATWWAQRGQDVETSRSSSDV